MTLDTIIILVIILCVYMWPLVIVANSERSRGNEKTFWILVTIFLSWIGLLLHQSATFNQKERRKRHKAKMEYEHKKAMALKRKQQMEEQTAVHSAEPIEVVEEVNEGLVDDEQSKQTQEPR